jgi:tetrahydromethanopterin S-methyltransferase subunit F
LGERTSSQKRCLSNALNTSSTTAATKAFNNKPATIATMCRIRFLAIGFVTSQHPIIRQDALNTFSTTAATKAPNNHLQRRIQCRIRFLAIGFVTSALLIIRQVVVGHGALLFGKSAKGALLFGKSDFKGRLTQRL